MVKKSKNQILSYQIKASLLKYFREKRNFIASAEVELTGRGIADILAYEIGRIIEVEIKIIKSDFDNDNKKRKFLFYDNKSYQDYVPNQFYYCVPSDMIEYVKEKLKNTPFGILSYNRSRIGAVKLHRGNNGLKYYSPIPHLKTKPIWELKDESIYTEKRAKNIRNNVCEKLKNNIVKSMANQISRVYSEYYYKDYFQQAILNKEMGIHNPAHVS